MDPRLYDFLSSAKLVFVVFEQQGQLTQKRLIAETRLSPRTVRYALTKLTEIGIVEEEMSFTDARQQLYSLS